MFPLKSKDKFVIGFFNQFVEAKISKNEPRGVVNFLRYNLHDRRWYYSVEKVALGSTDQC